jgi:hypothetical protein
LYTQSILDWRDRLDELNFFLNATWQINDPEVVAILAAALVSCPGTRPPWLVLETNWFSRDCSPAWFAFGGLWAPRSLAELRSLRPRQARELIREWLDESAEPRLFIECDFERLPHYARIPEIRFLLARSLRVRTMMPRSQGALTVDQREQARRADALRALTRQLAEDRARLRPEDPPAFRQPPNFFYHAELLQRLAPWFPDWNELINALASLAVHQARR